jgi:hypothetical protein
VVAGMILKENRERQVKRNAAAVNRFWRLQITPPLDTETSQL